MFSRSMFLVAILKVRVPDVGSKPFIPQAEPKGCELLPSCAYCYAGWGVMVTHVLASPTHFSMFLLVCQYVQESLSYFLGSFQKELFCM